MFNMIAYKIPHKSRFNPITIQADLVLNDPIPNGTFQSDNLEIEIMKIQKNSVYLFERLTVTANVSEETYQQSLIKDRFPTLIIYKKTHREPIFSSSLVFIGFQHERDVSTFITTNKEYDSLCCSLSGSLLQIPETIGFGKVTINLQFNFFIMDQNSYNENFRNELEANYASDIRR